MTLMSDSKLLFDIGNSRVKWAYCNQGVLESSGSLLTSEITNSTLDDNFGVQLKLKSVWISNVGGPAVGESIREWFSVNYSLETQFIGVTQSVCGIDNHYESQDTQGVDRWVAAVGARSVVEQGHVVIIDAGTAVTIDWLSDKNKYQGGAILPGFVLMHDALTSRTAGIKSEVSWAQQIIGRSTAECVNSGVSFGLVGAIERIVAQVVERIGSPASLLLTGGTASAIAARSDLDFIIEDNLVLLGVAKIANGGS